jgi:hypothetical protein
MKTTLLLLAAVFASWSASAQINVRISVKAVLNPATGMRQPGVTEATFTNTVNGMNALLDNLGRGYRIQWNGTLINVGGLNQFNSGPSKYYNLDFHDEDNEGMKEQMDADAQADPVAFGWNSSAVNIYITRYGGANWNVCSFPSGGSIIIVNGVAGYSTARTVLHEIGHYYNLSHTMNGQQFLNSDDSSCTNRCDCAQVLGGGSDGVSDTALDNECWDSWLAVAQGNGYTAGGITASESLATDRIWRNIMSYHGRHHNDIDILTPGQLDRWTDTANSTRVNSVSGRTRFVDLGNLGIQIGTSQLPWKTVASGIAAASAGGNDIVLIRPGSYDEPMTVTKPLTLRATRGTAVIGL